MSTRTITRPTIWTISPEQFVLSALVARRCQISAGQISAGGAQSWLVTFPNSDPADWYHQSQRIELVSREHQVEGSAAPTASRRKKATASWPVASMRVEGEFFEWLVESGTQPELPGDAMASRTVSGVHGLATRLFAAYQLDSGLTIQLGGCSFEDRASLCLSYSCKCDSTESGDAGCDVVRVFFDAEGNFLDDDLAESLGLPDWGLPDLGLAAWGLAGGGDDLGLADGGSLAVASSTGEAARFAVREAIHRVTIADSASQKGAAASRGLAAGPPVEKLATVRHAPRHARARYGDSHWQRVVPRAQERFATSRDNGGTWRLLAVHRVWSTWVEGRIHFVAEESTAAVPFQGWASQLLSGEQSAPPFTCPHSEEASYHIGVTDDNKITTADFIGNCEVSGKRVLLSDLGDCEWTQRRVHNELLETCPVTGHVLLTSECRSCDSCRQKVWPESLRGGRCLACRQLRTIEKSDPRLVRVLEEYPKLEVWRSWKISETRTAYILLARSWFRRLLIVLDKETLAPWHEASGSTLSANWRDA